LESEKRAEQRAKFDEEVKKKREQLKLMDEE
jgi:hypothetical protein